MFKTLKTSSHDAHKHKTLLVAHHGWGKTYQARYYAETYGKGLIVSGESGLASLADCDIDFLPASSWDGDHFPELGVYSFVGIFKMIGLPEFKEAGYNWIAIDSVTEMSERCLDHFQAKHVGNKNGFELWGDYERAIIGWLKWVRDLPVHVLVTSLAGEEEDDNGMTNYWPMVKMKKVAKHLPSLFDHVMCGVRQTKAGENGAMPTVTRYIVTEEVKGWHGKVRDPRNRVKPVEKCSNIVELHKRMAMSEEEYQASIGGATTKETT